MGLAPTIRCRTEAFADRRREAGSPLALRLELMRDEKLPEEVTIALFRVFQEGLSNVERHAQARSWDRAGAYSGRGAPHHSG